MWAAEHCVSLEHLIPKQLVQISRVVPHQPERSSYSSYVVILMSVSRAQLLVAEVHRRVVMEYLRSVMRGRIICTSMKMRKRMAGRLRDEGKQIKVLFKDLVSAQSHRS